MANVKDENPDFDELKLPDAGEVPPDISTDDLFGDLESFEISESLTAEEAVAPPAIEAFEIEGQPAKLEEALKEDKELGAEQKALKTPRKLPPYTEWAVASGATVLVLALVFVGLLTFSTMIYAIAVSFVSYGIWRSRKTNTVYTVILGCTLIAILTAIYCLWLELGRYHFDIKARGAKQQIGFRPPCLPGGSVVDTTSGSLELQRC